MPWFLSVATMNCFPPAVGRPDFRHGLVGVLRLIPQHHGPVQKHHGRGAHVDLAMDEDLAVLQGRQRGSESLEVFLRGVVETDRDVQIGQALSLDDPRFVCYCVGHGWRGQGDHRVEASIRKSGQRRGAGLARGDEGRGDLDDVGRGERRGWAGGERGDRSGERDDRQGEGAPRDASIRHRLSPGRSMATSDALKPSFS